MTKEKGFLNISFISMVGTEGNKTANNVFLLILLIHNCIEKKCKNHMDGSDFPAPTVVLSYNKDLFIFCALS